jgi:diguanylate cyclase
MIIKELFSNLAILASLLFLYSQLTNNRPLHSKSSIKRKIIVGILGGVIGNILMQYSIHIGDSIVDLRHIPIILLAFYGGFIPAYLAMVLIIIGRLLIGVNLASILAIVIILLVTTGAVFLAKSRFTKKTKVILSLTWNNLVFSILYTHVIKDTEILMILIPIYWVVSYLGGFAAFYIINYIRSIQLLFEKYKNESTIDGLTGLNNFRKFDAIFNDLLEKLEEKNEKLSLLYIDIDFFKKINDQYGHKQGDEVLKQLSEILQNSTRSFDIVSRNGGEEFTALLLDCPLEKAMNIAEKIRKAVEVHPFYLSGSTIHISVSIGVACYNETTMDAKDIIEDADKALYQAKSTGRNRVCTTMGISVSL